MNTEAIGQWILTVLTGEVISVAAALFQLNRQRRTATLERDQRRSALLAALRDEIGLLVPQLDCVSPVSLTIPQRLLDGENLDYQRHGKLVPLLLTLQASVGYWDQQIRFGHDNEHWPPEQKADNILHIKQLCAAVVMELPSDLGPSSLPGIDHNVAALRSMGQAVWRKRERASTPRMSWRATTFSLHLQSPGGAARSRRSPSRDSRTPRSERAPEGRRGVASELS
jgi:hypothetical protein